VVGRGLAGERKLIPLALALEGAPLPLIVVSATVGSPSALTIVRSGR